MVFLLKLDLFHRHAAACIRKRRVWHLQFMIYWTFQVLWGRSYRLEALIIELHLLVKFCQVFVLLDAPENFERLHLYLVDALGAELRPAWEHAQSSALRRRFYFRWSSLFLLLKLVRHCLIKEEFLCSVINCLKNLRFFTRFCIQLWLVGLYVVSWGFCSATHQNLRW